MKTTPEIDRTEVDGVQPVVDVRCWGVRGSSPVTRPEMLGFGGNTPCITVRSGDGPLLIFDAGTGILGLENALLATDWTRPVDIFLTHFHLDHIQGLPFFLPLHRPECEVRVHAPPQEDLSLDELLGSRLAPVYFPVPLRALGSHLSWRTVHPSDVIEIGGLEVDSIRVRHPSNTHGFRIRTHGITVVYIPDGELGDSDPEFEDRLTEFCRGADLLIHDAMYEEQEYLTRSGWGHSTFAQATELALRAGASALGYFHHAPWRTDIALKAIVEREADRVREAGADLEVFAAREGMAVGVRPGRLAIG